MPIWLYVVMYLAVLVFAFCVGLAGYVTLLTAFAGFFVGVDLAIQGSLWCLAGFGGMIVFGLLTRFFMEIE